MKRKKKNGIKLCSILLAVMMVVSVFVPAKTVSAKNCEEWWTKRGLVYKSGDNENGYTIGSLGDTSFTVCRYEEQLDILATEIQFTVKAWPTSGGSDDMWAYMNFGLDFEDTTFIRKLEENAPLGRVQIMLNWDPSGVFTFWVADTGIRTIFKSKNFDWDAVHTISFEQRSMGIFLVFDGIPFIDYDWTPLFEKHMGENTGKTYFAVGGNEAYEFTNLRIVPIEKKVVDMGDYVAPDNGGGKLGDIETEVVEEEPIWTPKIWVAIGIGAVSLVAASVIAICVVRSKKAKNKKEE